MQQSAVVVGPTETTTIERRPASISCTRPRSYAICIRWITWTAVVNSTTSTLA